LQEQLMQVLGGLTNREADVIKARYGLTDGQPKTLDEIGKVHGVTRSIAGSYLKLGVWCTRRDLHREGLTLSDLNR
ncbi:MAG: hypothetical protein EBR99_08475, partial [Actinobacteria bacterium]|nr:hypothetical protein [Actinomycetota bacterium]